MYKKPITYTDLNGVERTEIFNFHLSKPEMLKMQSSMEGGYDARLKGAANALDADFIIKFIEDLIRRAYGIKSEDGRRFMKSEEISRSFMECPAYEVLFDELTSTDEAALNFVNALISNSATE